MKTSLLSSGLVLALICLPITAEAAFLHEGFETYNLAGIFAQTKPGLPWYTYSDPLNVGNVTNVAPIPFGTQAFRATGKVGQDIGSDHTDFALNVAGQVSQVNFTARGQPPSEQGGSVRLGTMQWIQLESSAPRRELTQFYVFCNNVTFTAACEFRVRFQQVDTTGQLLIPSSTGNKEFNVTVIISWQNANYDLHVNGVDDGIFPFMDLPSDFDRLRINQYRTDYPMNLTLDNWDVLNGTLANNTVILGDVTGGILGFASDMHFTSAVGLFFYGIIVFIILVASVVVPSFFFARSNTIANSLSFFAILVGLWLVTVEIWPSWIGITLIVVASAFIGLVTRRLFLGIRNAAGGAGLAIGCLGYFIIASTFLGFSGYAAQTIQIPTGQANGDSSTETHTFIGAVADCIITLFSHCTESSVSSTWKAITNIFSWIQAMINYLFQLLTFQLPIPVVFNVLIVAPPAIGLATFAFQIIRGQATS